MRIKPRSAWSRARGSVCTVAPGQDGGPDLTSIIQTLAWCLAWTRPAQLISKVAYSDVKPKRQDLQSKASTSTCSLKHWSCICLWHKRKFITDVGYLLPTPWLWVDQTRQWCELPNSIRNQDYINSSVPSMARHPWRTTQIITTVTQFPACIYISASYRTQQRSAVQFSHCSCAKVRKDDLRYNCAINAVA